MNNGGNGIFVAESNGGNFVEVIGRGCYQNSQPLRQTGQDWLGKGTRELFVDLRQCQAMDSTFLGVLAGFALALRNLAPPSQLHLVNVSERHLHSLQMLGLDRVSDIASAESESFAR